jgi:mercuric ion binding protein
MQNRGTMRRLAALAAVGLLALAVPARAGESLPDATITIRGMVCSFCAQGLHKVFSAEKGVSKVHVSLESKTIALEFSPDAKVDDARLAALVSDAGYDVVKIERKVP